MLFTNFESLLRVVLVSVAAYVALIIVLRLAGKRALAKMHAFDFVVTVAFGSTLATVLLSKDIALAEGVLAFVVLALLQWIVSRLSLRWPGFRDAVRNNPRFLVQDGAYCRDAMKDERVTRNEVDAAIRSAGIGRLADVAAVVLEADGAMSVVRTTGDTSDVMDDVRA